MRRALRAETANARRAGRECAGEWRADAAAFRQRYGGASDARALRRCVAAKQAGTGTEPEDPADPSQPTPGSDECRREDATGTTIGLPYGVADEPYGLIPMGETVAHPKPQNPEGHPGIDFQWNHPARIVASAPGTVVAIEPSYWPNTWDVGVLDGCYLNGYTELESYNPQLAIGAQVAAGAFIGYPWHPTGTHETYRMIHWQFGIYTGSKVNPNRLCPMTYFDPGSRARIEQTWAATTWEYKGQFPYVCSGDYRGKDR